MNAILPTLVSLSLASVSATPVTSKISLDHGAVLSETTSTVYLLVELEAEAAPAAAERQPLNVALVIDRSGSMADAHKLDYAKAAATKLVDALLPTDYISLVQYDDAVQTLWPSSSSPAASKALLKRRIASIRSAGGTNLTAGMLRGADQVAKHLSSERINRVILLSDGLANEGVTDPREIAKLVRKRKQAGVHVTTMGLGADYNEDLMQAIAEVSGGRYYFIEHPSQMARVFEEEMSILAKSVAKDVRIRFDTGGIVKNAEVFGYTAKRSGKQVLVEQEDIYAGEARSMLIRLELEPSKAGQFTLGTLLVEYTDLETKRPLAIEKEVGLVVTADKSTVDGSRNDRVLAESTLIEADREQLASTRMYESGNKSGAKQLLQRVRGKLAANSALTKDKRLMKKLQGLEIEEEQMDAADASPSYRKVYLKKSKGLSGLGTKGKRGTYLLDQGESGYLVERLQTALQKQGLYAGKIDGDYDAAVSASVEAFQTKQGLEVDGVAGPRTLNALGLY